jgi:hypothetical protein
MRAHVDMVAAVVAVVIPARMLRVTGQGAEDSPETACLDQLDLVGGLGRIIPWLCSPARMMATRASRNRINLTSLDRDGVLATATTSIRARVRTISSGFIAARACS